MGAPGSQAPARATPQHGTGQGEMRQESDACPCRPFPGLRAWGPRALTHVLPPDHVAATLGHHERAIGARLAVASSAVGCRPRAARGDSARSVPTYTRPAAALSFA